MTEVLNTPINIIKASGEVATFDEQKLRSSLQKSGATEDKISGIVAEISSSLFEGISTKEIYKKAFSLLRKSSRSTAARYNLKRAIYDLGPTGFPFEKFVAAILQHEGFVVETGVTVSGHCVTHEVDVVAAMAHKHFMVECKFHSDKNRFCDVKIPLYINSRFQDVEKQWKKSPGHEEKFHQGWIFTNTRFTSDAIQYGTCAGLMLVGWNYPHKGSLNERIDASGLHPVTSLTTISRHEKGLLLEQGFVLCMDICNNPVILKKLGIIEARHPGILKEASDLCFK